MHIGYVPQERPPFSALNFRSGAYHFHKFPKNPFRSITILHFLADFCRSGDHHFQNFFNFNPFIASHGRLSPNAAPRVSQTRPGSSGESHFHAKTDQARSGAPIIKLKTAQARSGDPHFYARPGARSGALANFSLCRGTYLPHFWGEYPPPPQASILIKFGSYHDVNNCALLIGTAICKVYQISPKMLNLLHFP